jgi:hypothetical protein
VSRKLWGGVRSFSTAARHNAFRRWALPPFVVASALGMKFSVVHLFSQFGVEGLGNNMLCNRGGGELAHTHVAAKRGETLQGGGTSRHRDVMRPPTWERAPLLICSCTLRATDYERPRSCCKACL